MILALAVMIVIAIVFLVDVIRNGQNMEVEEEVFEEQENSETDTSEKIPVYDHSLELPEIDIDEFLVDNEETDFRNDSETESTDNDTDSDHTQTGSDTSGFIGSEPGELPEIELIGGD